MQERSKDERFMREALKVARKGLGRTSPNPPVGAVIVKDDRIVARGFHRRAGLPHAEVEALEKFREDPSGAVMYVTLEPCNHYGKQPPCTEAILKKGIRRVVVGMKDPNPGVDGGGAEFLMGHGVSVSVGVLEKECQRLVEGFVKFVTSGLPFVTVKTALTADGYTGSSTGDSKWITNEKSRTFVHRLRDRSDAVMVGVGTVMADDPMLTVRSVRGKVKDPIRVIVDTRLNTPPDSKVVNHRSYAPTIIAVGKDLVPQDKKDLFEQKKGVSLLFCPTRDGHVDLNALMRLLAEKGVVNLLVEGGARLVGSMIREEIPDKFLIFHAPKIYGGNDGIPMAAGPGPERMDLCISLHQVRYRRFDEDMLMEGYPDYPMKKGRVAGG